MVCLVAAEPGQPSLCLPCGHRFHEEVRLPRPGPPRKGGPAQPKTLRLEIQPCDVSSGAVAMPSRCRRWPSSISDGCRDGLRHFEPKGPKPTSALRKAGGRAAGRSPPCRAAPCGPDLPSPLTASLPPPPSLCRACLAVRRGRPPRLPPVLLRDGRVAGGSGPAPAACKRPIPAPLPPPSPPLPPPQLPPPRRRRSRAAGRRPRSAARLRAGARQPARVLRVGPSAGTGMVMILVTNRCRARALQDTCAHARKHAHTRARARTHTHTHTHTLHTLHTTHTHTHHRGSAGSPGCTRAPRAPSAAAT